jgi:hypothetical protein
MPQCRSAAIAVERSRPPSGMSGHCSEHTLCNDQDMSSNVGARVEVSGGYDFEPGWLAGRSKVAGVVAKWIPGQNSQPACVVMLDEPLTATGDVKGRREVRTGSFLVLETRYKGHEWEATGTVHLELCDFEPQEKPWAERPVGAWIESHATYAMLTG